MSRWRGRVPPSILPTKRAALEKIDGQKARDVDFKVAVRKEKKGETVSEAEDEARRPLSLESGGRAGGTQAAAELWGAFG